MYAGMKVKFHEVVKTRNVAVSNESIPLFWCVFSSDKGTEEMTELNATDFFKMYGNTADFFKYGQPLIQTHAILRAGGKVLGKRIVAPDATLANIILFGEVTEETANKVDADGNQIYIDADGNETTEVTDTPATIATAVLKYTVSTVQNVTTFDEVVKEANKAASSTKFPLIVITDNGRGASIKKFRIVPDYTNSKTLNFCMYNLVQMENTSVVDTTRFSVNSDVVYYNYNGQSRSLNLIENSASQMKTLTVDDQIKKFIAEVSKISGYSEEVLLQNDVLFGCTKKGELLEGIRIDDTGVKMDHQYGVDLLSGLNGSFGDGPFKDGEPVQAWTDEVVKYFSGDVTDEIYDYELHKVDFIFDANYPDAVKRKIEEVVNWRQDAFFFRDLGTDIWSFDDVINKVSMDDWTKSPFIGDYMTTYEIIDNLSKKQIRVTMTHGMAPLMVSHYTNNAAAPMAGIFNGFTITEALPGTINFSPRVTPKINHKELLDDLRVNFANYETNTSTYVVQALYTSQDHIGPWSYANNVIITQMAVKSVRNYVPRIRFQLMDASDFSMLKKLIDDNCLNAYSKYFSKISLQYTQDDEAVANKIFDCSLECYYKNFPKGEYMDVFAIDGSPDDDAATYTTTVYDI